MQTLTTLFLLLFVIIATSNELADNSEVYERKEYKNAFADPKRC